MNELYQINIALDIFSALITILLGVHVLSRKHANRENRYFFWMCVFNLLFILGDLSDWCCQGFTRPWFPAALHAGQFLYYASVAPLLLMLLKYVTEYLASRNVHVPKIYMRIALGLCMVHLTGCVLTPFTGLYYVITDTNEYVRGDFIAVPNASAIAIYGMILVLAVRYGKHLGLRAALALLSYILIPLLGQAVQAVFRGVATLNPAVMLALLAVYFNMQVDMEVQYEKDRQELARAQTLLMLSQIQPHFLYNVLTVIRRLCEIDSKKARDAINDFSIFLRANMDSISNSQPISFVQELRHTQSYLNLEQQRFGDELRVEYDIQATDFCLPALSLQPIVENAVQQGLRKKDGGGTVAIRAEETQTHVQGTVADEGMGFDAGVLDDGDAHIGMKNVSKRLAMLCGGEMTCQSKAGRGTTVVLWIPKGGSRDEISGRG